MSETIRVGRWTLRPDLRRTREAHAALAHSGAAACICDGCKNFEAVRAQFLSGPIGAILEQLGITPPWEVEVYETGRAESGLHQYGGWFHFVGTIESGDHSWREMPGHPSVRVPDFETLTPALKVGFHNDAALVRDSFKGMPVVQLEFLADLPWLIDSEPPL